MNRTRPQQALVGVLALLLGLAVPGLAFAQAATEPATPPADLGLPRDVGPAIAADSATEAPAPVAADPNAIDSLMDELTATSEIIKDQPGAEGPTDFSGPPQDSTNWVQALRVTRDDNPLLEKQCKEQAMHMTVNSLAALEGAANMEEAQQAVAAHLRHHLETLKDGSIGHADYLREIAECKEFCAPLVAQLMQCHILSVARLEHGIVLFDLGSDVVTPAYRSGLIDTVSKQLREHGERKAVLIGRASQIGDLRHNRALSARRALAVKDALMAAGVGAERIETMWFGWEPPQISVPIASEYGLSRLFDTVGVQKINQSVVVVMY